MSRTLLCLARHGETNWNLERRFQGQLDIALNVKGRMQAAALGKELADAHFDYIYSSDLKRALTTAAPHAAARGFSIQTNVQLREKHDGIWHGLSHPEVAALYPEDYSHYLARRADYAAQGGESLMRFAARVRAALTQIAQAHPGKALLVVAHAGALDIAWRMATNKRLDEAREYPVLNAAPNWVAYEDGKWSLIDWAKEEGRTLITAPYERQELVPRESARLLLLNQRNEVLLLNYSSRLSPNFFETGHKHFWAPPGGALEHGESFEQAATRELYEETGLIGAKIGAPVASREFPMQLRDKWVQAVERYFLVRCDAFEPKPRALTKQERADILGWKWWRLEDIGASDELIFPEALDHMLAQAPA